LRAVDFRAVDFRAVDFRAPAFLDEDFRADEPLAPARDDAPREPERTDEPEADRFDVERFADERLVEPDFREREPLPRDDFDRVAIEPDLGSGFARGVTQESREYRRACRSRSARELAMDAGDRAPRFTAAFRSRRDPRADARASWRNARPPRCRARRMPVTPLAMRVTSRTSRGAPGTGEVRRRAGASGVVATAWRAGDARS
jgi:hypothetical protein